MLSLICNCECFNSGYGNLFVFLSMFACLFSDLMEIQSISKTKCRLECIKINLLNVLLANAGANFPFIKLKMSSCYGG